MEFSLITTGLVVCFGLFGLVIFAGGLYGFLVWYPRQRQNKIDDLKKTGKQGEGTIIRLPDNPFHRENTHSLHKMINLRLEIRVPGIEPYQVDKTFTFPSRSLDLLEEGKAVTVWVDPNDPRNVDKITMEIK